MTSGTASRTFEAISRLSLERRSFGVRWGFAALAFAVAVTLRWVLDPHLPPGFPFLTFFPVVMLTTFFCGLQPAIAVAVASFFASWTLFVSPRFSASFTQEAMIAMGFYTFIVVINIMLIHIMSRAIRHLSDERMRSAQLAEQQRLMFHELQHRVSNNLAMVAGLLTIQRRRLTDAVAIKALEDAVQRINLVARMKRLLHDPTAQDLDFGGFLTSMTRDLTEAAGVADRIDCCLSCQPIRIFRDKAIPLGLIATELLSNSLEHGFAEGEPGTLSVLLMQNGDEAVLQISDSGRGLPDGFDLEKADSLGLMIARQFTQQVGGTLTMKNRAGGGAVSELSFPLT